MTRWLRINVRIVQACAALFAIVATAYSIFWESISDILFPIGPVIEFREMTVYNATVGGRFYVTLRLTKWHPECLGEVRYSIRDRRGVVKELPVFYPGLAPKAALIDIPWAHDWALPDGLVPGPAEFFGEHPLTTPGKRHCNQKISTAPIPFTIYAPNLAKKIADDGDPLKLGVGGVRVESWRSEPY